MNWARDTYDVRQSLILLIEALEIRVKGATEGDITIKFPSSVSNITVYYQQSNISKQN